MPAPDTATVRAYVGGSFTDDEVTSALAAEKASQAARCRVPADDAAWPADLTEALCRRVATNLANRNLPLGTQANVSEAGVGYIRVGGTDREVARLEAPYRRVMFG